MPATTIHRVVRNTSVAAGGLYYFERDGALLRPLPNSGLKLKPDATNGVWVYRVASPSGVPLPMVGPATLTVRYKDPDAPGALVDIAEYTAAEFDAAERCFKFDLSATDFAAHNGRDLAYFFKDSSVASVEASLESVLLYEQRPGDLLTKVGTWRILSATVAGLSDRAVRFESSDPSVCRIERGDIASGYLQIAGEQVQSDQYCVLVGAGAGTCEIRCVAEGDENQTDVVQVTVQVHPDDVPQPRVSGSGLATELSSILHNVRVPISLLPPKKSPGGTRYAYQEYLGPQILFSRTFAIPGSPDDTFDISLNFSGLVPKTNARYFATENGSLCLVALVIGLVNGTCLGVPPRTPVIAHDLSVEYDMPLNSLCDDLGLGSAQVVNNHVTPRDSGDTTEVLDEDIAFVAQGGDQIMVFWVIDGFGGTGFNEGSTYFQDLPTGDFHALLTVNSITHHAPNEAPPP